MSVNSSMMGLLESYPYHSLAALFLGFMLFSQLKKGRSGNPKGLPLPPGPKGYPLIGNLFDMPIFMPWVVYEEWCKTYGDMIYFNVLGQHFLVLGSPQRTTDLLEKRSSNYSDRMRLPMLLELMDWDFNFGFLPYGAWWRKQRKSFHEFFHLNIVSRYLPIQRRQIHFFCANYLLRLTTSSTTFSKTSTFAATIMKIVYGIEIQESDDPYISLAEEAMKGGTEAGIPGTFWVDILPILKYVPSWFPGASFQRKAAYWRELNAAVVENPFRHVEEQLKSGKAVPSMAATLIERLPREDDPQRPIEEKLAKDVAAVAYVAGAETTASTVKALFLAMVLYPEVQKKAQTEIDTVIGPNRLPDFEDRPSLPYINAIVRELVRWHVVLPIGVPHMATNDDEYDGYYIPKGTVVLSNAWSILHDPEVFNNPMEFQPERFLKDGNFNADVRDPSSVAFGFGRRICPGRHLNDNSIYLIVSCLLAVYDIKPPVDDQGTAIKLKPEFTTEALAHPIPFKCIIKPRTPAAAALILDTANA